MLVDKGYLLPDDPSPAGLICLRIWIPDDPRYLHAMGGQFHDLGTWLLWEKDGTNRGSLAARAWKDAIDYTYEHGWLNCGDDMEQIDDIIRRLEEIENMNINVNCGCGCGCSCGSGQNGSGSVNTTFDPSLDYAPPPPVPGSENTIGVSGWKCDYANQILDDWQRFTVETIAVGAAGVITVDALTGIAVALTVLSGGLAFALVIISLLAVTAASQVLDWVQEWLGAHKDGLICAIMEGTSPATSHDSAVAYVDANEADPFGSFAGHWLGYVVKGLIGDTNWNALYEPDSVTIEASNVGSDCTECSPAAQFDLVSYSDFDDAEGQEPTQISGGSFYENGYVRFTIAAASGSSTPGLTITLNELESHTGIDIAALTIEYIAFDINKSTVNGDDYDKDVTLSVQDSLGLSVYWQQNADTLTAVEPAYQRIEIQETIEVAFPSGGSTILLQMTLEKIGDLGGVHIDNLEIRGTITAV